MNSTMIRQINRDAEARKSRLDVLRNFRISGIERYPIIYETTSPMLINAKILFPCLTLKSRPAIPQKLTKVIYTINLTQVYIMNVIQLESKA
jgi:hypothetical protein